MNNLTLISFIVLLVGVMALPTWEKDHCIHDNKDGFCVNINKCASHRKMFQRPEDQPMTDAEKDYLRSLQCGWDGNTPKTCCVGGWGPQ